MGIIAKEFTTIILSCVAGGKAVQCQKVLFQCDNSSIVASTYTQGVMQGFACNTPPQG